ncbi:MAG TPA: hypothetical protein VMF89_31820 [Polyangiales bacterium]|nr:hypothetical protein [Polyangiales bacterium]
MSNTGYALKSSMRQARASYFAANNFDDSGYNDDWVTFKLGPVPLTIPSTAGRKRAIAFHDLHHIVTGYPTDYAGEFEISAWEVGAGCGTNLAVWVINLSGLAGGSLFVPTRAFHAFCLGRRTHTLYRREINDLLDQTVEETRRDCGLIPQPNVEPQLTDAALYAAATLVGLVLGVTMAAAGLIASPIILGLSALRPRST